MIRQRQILFFIFPLLISLFFTVSCSLAQASTEEEIQAQKKEIEALYREGISLYFTFFVASQDESDVLKSKEIFERILDIDPTEEKAKIYLNEKIPTRLENLRRIKKEREEQAVKQKILEEENHLKRKKLKAQKKIIREKIRQKQEERRIQAEIKKQENLRRQTERETEAKASREAYLAQREKNKQAKVLYKEAFRLYHKDRLDEAKKIFEQILEIDPNQEQAKIFIEKRIPSRQKKLGR